LSLLHFPSRNALLKGSVIAGVVTPQIAFANPVVSFQDRVHLGALIGLTVFAMATEALLTSALLILICGINQRFLLIGLLFLLNIFTFFFFVVFLYSVIHSVIVIELLILSVEALLIVQVTRLLGERPILLRNALLVAVVGNLLSFLVGLSA
jgi:hypothetical protein